MAHPHHVGLGGQQRDGSAVGQHGQPLDGRGMPTEKPGAAALEQEVQRERDVLGRLDPVVGQRVAVADLDADVRAVQPAKRLLVGHVVAEEHRGRRALLVAQDVERLALVGLDHRELQHCLALGDLGVPRLRGRACAFFSASSASAGSALRTCSAMLAGLISIATPGYSAAIAPSASLILRSKRLCGVVDAVHETGVELRAVAADQVHLGGHPGQRGQIAQRPPGDQRGHMVDGSAASSRIAGGGFGERTRIVGVGDDRRHRAVVVAGDEDTGNASDRREGALQLGR